MEVLKKLTNKMLIKYLHFIILLQGKRTGKFFKKIKSWFFKLLNVQAKKTYLTKLQKDQVTS